MTERVSHLLDAMLRWVQVRQRVLTMPYRLRYQMAWNHGLGGAVLWVHTRTEAVAVPHMRELLPLSHERKRNLAARPQASRRLPMFTMDAEQLLPAVIRQCLFSSVYRAAAESLASRP